jgi:hypothetical protein
MSDAADAGRAPLTLAEYQRLASRTINPALSPDQRLLDASAGLAEEAGEVLGLVRKHLFMQHDLDTTRLVAELGDAPNDGGQCPGNLAGGGRRGERRQAPAPLS